MAHEVLDATWHGSHMIWRPCRRLPYCPFKPVYTTGGAISVLLLAPTLAAASRRTPIAQSALALF